MVTLAIGGTQRMTREEADKTCSQYQALYSNIDADLARWKHEGISLKLMWPCTPLSEAGKRASLRASTMARFDKIIQ